MINIRKFVFNNVKLIHFNKSQVRRESFLVKNIHEPDYLEYLNPLVPYYPLLNVQVCGYDYAVLEKLASYIHKLSNKLGVEVTSFWCATHKSTIIDTLKPDSNTVENTYALNLYERNIQVKNLSAKMAPILIEVIHSSLPAGVQLSIHQHDHEQHYLSRYITDTRLEALHKQLEEVKKTELPDIVVPKK